MHTIISGGAAGVDTLAEKYADEHKLSKYIIKLSVEGLIFYLLIKCKFFITTSVFFIKTSVMGLKKIIKYDIIDLYIIILIKINLLRATRAREDKI